LLINIVESEWSQFVGDLEGFTATVEAPELIKKVENINNENILEAKSMAGTDESV
jgi:hypothetical protein